MNSKGKIGSEPSISDLAQGSETCATRPLTGEQVHAALVGAGFDLGNYPTYPATLKGRYDLAAAIIARTLAAGKA